MDMVISVYQGNYGGEQYRIATSLTVVDVLVEILLESIIGRSTPQLYSAKHCDFASGCSQIHEFAAPDE
jgi:hypothetical protein